MPVERQILSIYAGTNGYLDTVPVEAVREYEQELLRFVDENHPGLWKAFAEEKQLSDKLKGQIESVLEAFRRGLSTWYGTFVGLPSPRDSARHSTHGSARSSGGMFSGIG